MPLCGTWGQEKGQGFTKDLASFFICGGKVSLKGSLSHIFKFVYRVKVLIIFFNANNFSSPSGNKRFIPDGLLNKNILSGKSTSFPDGLLNYHSISEM